jgi:DNA mismatch repair protein MutL
MNDSREDSIKNYEYPRVTVANNLVHKQTFSNSSLFELSDISANHFGKARIQLFNSYILSEANDCYFVIDQHAAHERVNYEMLKKKVLGKERLPAQKMLVPIDLNMSLKIDGNDVEIDVLSNLGFEIKVQEKKVQIEMMPSILQKNCNDSMIRMMEEIFDEIFFQKAAYDKLSSIMAYKIDKVCASIACHASIKAGQVLSIEEMNALISEMEVTSNIGQCNHGRPTHVRLLKSALDNVFER